MANLLKNLIVIVNYDKPSQFRILDWLYLSCVILLSYKLTGADKACCTRIQGHPQAG